MKLYIKKQTHTLYTIITQASIRDAAPESYQVRPESPEGLINPHPAR